MSIRAIIRHESESAQKNAPIALLEVPSPERSRRISSSRDTNVTQATAVLTNTQDVTNSDEGDPVAWLKLCSCAFSFFCAGVDGGSLGTLLPYFSRYYGISLGTVSAVYGAGFAGWCVAGVANSAMNGSVGFGTILILGAFFQLLSQCLRFWNPPFAVFCIGFFFSALGLAFQDSHANTYVSTFKGAHRWLGLIHGIFAIGMVVAPFPANLLASRNPERWGLYYVIPLGLDVLNLALVCVAFRDSVRRAPNPLAGNATAENTRLQSVLRGRTVSFFGRIMQPIKAPGTWQLCLWFFFYMGAAFVQYGWIVEFLVVVRHGKLSQMGYVPTGAFGGAALGRFILPEVFHRFGPRRSVFVCSIIWIVGQILVLTVPNIPAVIVVITLMSFVGGPFFPTAIAIGSEIFSKEDKPAALGFVFIAAQAGAALFPTITGVIAEYAGVKALQPICIGLMTVAAGTWLLIPRRVRREE